MQGIHKIFEFYLIAYVGDPIIDFYQGRILTINDRHYIIIRTYLDGESIYDQSLKIYGIEFSKASESQKDKLITLVMKNQDRHRNKHTMNWNQLLQKHECYKDFTQ